MVTKNVLLALVMAMLFSCDKCQKFDCKPSLTVSIEVTDTSGRNLFAQPDPDLFIDSLEIIAVHPNHTYNVPYEKNEEPIVTFSPTTPDVYVVRYSFEESDTLIFKNRVFDKNECCSMVKHYDLEINHQPYCTVCKDEIITIVR